MVSHKARKNFYGSYYIFQNENFSFSAYIQNVVANRQVLKTHSKAVECVINFQCGFGYLIG